MREIQWVVSPLERVRNSQSTETPPSATQRIISEREKVRARKRVYRNIAKLIREFRAACGGRRSIAEMKSVTSKQRTKESNEKML